MNVDETLVLESTVVPLVLRVLPGDTLIEVRQENAVLGRTAAADVRLAGAEISRRHCRVEYALGQWRIVDLNSLNGIWINGQRVREGNLKSGDALKIGNMHFIVVQANVKPIDAQDQVLKSIAKELPQRKAS